MSSTRGPRHKGVGLSQGHDSTEATSEELAAWLADIVRDAVATALLEMRGGSPLVKGTGAYTHLMEYADPKGCEHTLCGSPAMRTWLFKLMCSCLLEAGRDIPERPEQGRFGETVLRISRHAAMSESERYALIGHIL